MQHTITLLWSDETSCAQGRARRYVRWNDDTVRAIENPCAVPECFTLSSQCSQWFEFSIFFLSSQTTFAKKICYSLDCISSFRRNFVCVCMRVGAFWRSELWTSTSFLFPPTKSYFTERRIRKLEKRISEISSFSSAVCSLYWIVLNFFRQNWNWIDGRKFLRPFSSQCSETIWMRDALRCSWSSIRSSMRAHFGFGEFTGKQ